MKVKFLGHSSFLVTSSDGQRILIDPYVYDSPDITYGKIEEEADIVLLTHETKDHGGVSAEGLTGKPTVVKGDSTQTVDGIEFRAMAVDHDRAGGAQLGTVTTWSFMLDDVRLVHLGDLGRPLTTPEVVELGGRVGVMCVPVGGDHVLGPRDASTVVEKVAPRVAIPMHYKTDKCSLPLRSVDDYLALKQIVQKVETSEREFRAGVLPPKYPLSLVLNPAL